MGAGLVLPFADTNAMQNHLDEISQAVAPGAHAVLLMDRAGWHTTGELKMPAKIRINVTSINNTLDPRLEVFDPDGILLHVGHCNSNGGINPPCGFSVETPNFSEMPSENLPKDGTYLLAFSDNGINETGSFDISINCLFPAGACPGVIQPVVCEIVLSQSVYMDGDTVTADVLRFANPDSEAENTRVEWKVWLDRPSGSPIQIISIGDKG